MKKMGKSCPAENRKEIAFQMDAGYEAARELIETNPGIDTIFCATDTIAVGVFVYLRNKILPFPIRSSWRGWVIPPLAE